MNGSAAGERELTIGWHLLAEEKGKVLAQVLTGEEAETDSEEIASTGNVSAELSTGKNEAAVILSTVRDCGKV